MMIMWALSVKDEMSPVGKKENGRAAKKEGETSISRMGLILNYMLKSHVELKLKVTYKLYCT